MTLLALTAAASEAAETVTDTALVEGAILLGVATLFVLIFRRLGLGAVGHPDVAVDGDTRSEKPAEDGPAHSPCTDDRDRTECAHAFILGLGA